MLPPRAHLKAKSQSAFSTRDKSRHAQALSWLESTLPCIASHDSYSAAADYAEVAFKFLRMAGCVDGDGAFFDLGLVRSHRRQFMIC
jgi:hypothetical protein